MPTLARVRGRVAGRGEGRGFFFFPRHIIKFNRDEKTSAEILAPPHPPPPPPFPPNKQMNEGTRYSWRVFFFYDANAQRGRIIGGVVPGHVTLLLPMTCFYPFRRAIFQIESPQQSILI